jgi:hypothetical protein
MRRKLRAGARVLRRPGVALDAQLGRRPERPRRLAQGLASEQDHVGVARGRSSSGWSGSVTSPTAAVAMPASRRMAEANGT